jgi:MinD-like ATPase involved in chromosome partitioning or flagellar assembly
VTEAEVALVFTPEPWVEDLHRHLSDHGGARVRVVVVEPAVALEEAYDVLLVGHRWPGLTRGLVADVHARGRTVVGVYDREEPASREHLRDVGVDEVVASDEHPSAFVRALDAVREAPAPAPEATPVRRAGQLVVVGGPPGSGRTELAVQLAREWPALVADCDTAMPAVAARLGLPIEPNLRTAVDAVEHGRGDADASIARGDAGLEAVVGLPNPRAWPPLRPGEVVRVLERLAASRHVVVDGAGALGDADGGHEAHAVARALVAEADVLVAVGTASPVGVARLLAWVADARAIAPDRPLALVVNRAPRGPFTRGELLDEVAATVPGAEVVLVPDDRRVGTAAWRGAVVAAGPFTRSVAHLARVARRSLAPLVAESA